ncbi:zinc-dependent metalloprotease [Cellulosimicrobium arenosum]|uniref:Zinc-dependent metalloprotease n=1 Tax=Cellulosimicrobium arenosum TaxID=2708133 RepID=A0A927G7M9_9MICO|nr:zinc-dependent metalloprotease [Cellulosimicrobium arenosum]MBD8078228.1 zinc-dependent metalloprotease [Cellulosimicrobium arenosum]
MSPLPPDDGAPGADDATPWDQGFEELLRQMLGADADAALRELRERGFDPGALAGPGAAGADPQLVQHVLAQVQRLLSTPSDGPVNTGVAHDVARQVAVAEGDPSLTAAQAREATQALSVAELWLDAVTDLAPSGGRAHAWSRSEWVEATLPAWDALVAPVAASVADALATVLRDQLPDGLGDLGGTGSPELPGVGFTLPGQTAGSPGLPGTDPTALMRRMGSAVFGMQVGQAAGTMSREVFGATDVGLPLLDEPATVLLPTNVAAFADGLDAPAEEVRLFLALREAAHARLFTHVSWLRGHLRGLVDAYARGITIDLGELESQLRDVDLTDTAALQGALSSGGVFGLQNTPEQQATLLRLETTLALVEGWVDEVTAAAALPHLPHAVPLREMLRRRRAAGGPAEHTFASLVGLELRPRRSRDAAALWARIAGESGAAGREAVWAHPDLLPDATDLDDPAGYATRRETARAEEADVDRALEEIFRTAGDDSDDPPAQGTP